MQMVSLRSNPSPYKDGCITVILPHADPCMTDFIPQFRPLYHGLQINTIRILGAILEATNRPTINHGTAEYCAVVCTSFIVINVWPGLADRSPNETRLTKKRLLNIHTLTRITEESRKDNAVRLDVCVSVRLSARVCMSASCC